MTGAVADPLAFDPADLPGFYARAGRLSGRDCTLSLRTILLGPDVLERLPEVLSAPIASDRHPELNPGFEIPAYAGMTESMRHPGLDPGSHAGADVLLVMDDRPMERAGESLKPLVEGILAEAGRSVRRVVLADPHGLHTTPAMIDRVREELSPGTVVVSVGSGTITDIAKHAVHGWEEAHPGRRPTHVAVATANSVGAYTSQLAVVTVQGVKRTEPSRLPEALVLDTRTLADTPEQYALGGIGDAAVGWCSLADYRLAAWCGLGSWEPLSKAAFLPGLTAFLDQDPAFATGGTATADAMARTLCAAGFAMSFAGESAPASGLEHVTSHMLDMAAPAHRRPIGNHGEQCGLATALVLIAYEYLLTEFDPSGFAGGLPPVDLDRERRSVDEVFAPLDPSGAMAAECWRDYAAKCAAWEAHRDDVVRLLETWDERSAELRELVADPGRYLAALAATGHPIDFADVPPGLSRAEVRWAFTHARLMRRRLSVADLLGFLGLWTDELVDRVFARFDELRSRVQPSTGGEPPIDALNSRAAGCSA